MSNNRAHHLLEQVPLTVSPFINLPSANTLSYNYKTMPSALPPSSLGIAAASSADDNDPAAQANRPRYIVSSSGHAAHPDDIISSCRALQAHVSKMQDDADRELRALEERIRERELAEKRRLAPGWLDSESRLLEPERSGAAAGDEAADSSEGAAAGQAAVASEEPADTEEGQELDRAFGGMALK